MNRLQQAQELIIEAMKSGDEEKLQKAFQEYSNVLTEELAKEAKACNTMNDQAVLASRGVRQLTVEEKTFYEAFANAMKAENPKEALTKIEVAFPESIVDEVFEGIVQEHPVLGFVDFQNTSTLTKGLFSTGKPEAAFGKLTSKITSELSAQFEMVTMELMKLSAFISVPKDYLELGMEWLDRYVRTLLVESIGNGLEKAVLTNLNTSTGPISMRADLSTGSAKKGQYTPGAAQSYTAQTKTKNKLADLGVKTIGGLMAKLAKDDAGKARKVVNPFMVVSYGDYYTKFAPATTMLNAAGQYISDVLPFGAKVVPSAYMTDGEAIIGIDKQYYLGLGIGSTEKGRAIECSDEVHFIEDERVYIIKAHANGFPKDNSSFILCDTSTLTGEPAMPVTVKGTVTTSATV